MNVIELCGGLGNQMFQYAFGRTQQENGIDVSFSKRWYGKIQHPLRPYRLDKFHTDIKHQLFLHQHTVREKHTFDPRYLRTSDCNFKGYWQYLDYFKGILDILQNEFYVQKKHYTSEFERLRAQITESPSVSLHVRRGDYINRKGFGTLPLLYYFKALEQIDKDVPVYVFSDDMPWCKHVFTAAYFSRKFIFVHLEDYLDFELMRVCDSHILANSTFGYLAAILDDEPEKIVVCPPGWLVIGGIPIEDRDKNIPKHWIKIKDYV